MARDQDNSAAVGKGRFRRFAEQLPVPCWLADSQGKALWFNQRWHDYCGSSPETMADNGWMSVHDPAVLPTVIARWRECLATGTGVEIVFPMRGADGTYRDFLTRVEPQRDSAGRITQWSGVATDVSDYRRARELLATNARTFTDLIVSNPFGIYVINADFQITEVSMGALGVFANVDPLIGRDLAEAQRIIWPEPFASEAIDRFRHTLETGEPYVSTSTVERRADVDAVEAYDWRIERIVLPDGQHGVICYFYDLSERNAYEEKLTRALADKDLLAREIDHRVKNSLTVVGSLLRMQRTSLLSPETRAALNEAADRVVAIARVHERLHKSHELGVVAFGEYLQQMCNDLETAMGPADVEVECHVVAIDVAADAAMPLALIVNELVTNAYKHGAAAGAKTISVSLSRGAGTVTLDIRDDGAGMPDPMPDGNASLGLKLVEAMVAQLGADANFPAPGQPATFTLTVAEERLLTNEHAESAEPDATL